METGIELIQLGQQCPFSLEPGIEQSRANFMVAGHSLLLIASPQLSQREIKLLTEGPVQFGLYSQDGVTLVLFDFSDGFTMVFPFNAAAIPEHLFEEYSLDEAKTTYRPISLIAVDTMTGIVKGLRVFTIPPVANVELLRAAYADRESNLPPRIVYNRLEILFGRYSNEDLFRNIKLHPCGE